MALRMLRLMRRADELEGLRRRHLAAVYRYAFAVLPSESDAEEVTRATFDHARRRLAAGPALRPGRPWLLSTAHGLCRARAADVDGDAGMQLDGGECAETERLLSRALDGRVARPDRRRLDEHLLLCAACRARLHVQLAVRHAFRSLADVPVPAHLAAADGRFTSSARPGSLAREERRPMAIMTRRNAVIGWAAWRVGKKVARRKAKNAVPNIDPESRRPNKPAALAAAVAALVGGLVFWRRTRGGEGSE
jgi:Putative zinc-finger